MGLAGLGEALRQLDEDKVPNIGALGREGHA